MLLCGEGPKSGISGASNLKLSDNFQGVASPLNITRKVLGLGSAEGVSICSSYFEMVQ